MSEHISLLHKDKVITSLAADGAYRIAVHNKATAPMHFLFMGADKSYTYEQYCDVLQGLWEQYLAAGKRPKLLRLALSDDGLVTETLHCIAPTAWYGPPSQPLPPYREKFAYWLKSKIKKIKKRINEEDFDYLNLNLETILRIHLSQKNQNPHSWKVSTTQNNRMKKCRGNWPESLTPLNRAVH